MSFPRQAAILAGKKHKFCSMLKVLQHYVQMVRRWSRSLIRSFHGIHNVDRGVPQATWKELAGKVGHRDHLIIC